MCSNTSSGSYGDLQDDYSGSCRKKQKKDNKVRRRGPGVAELEKIRLLEEENKSPSLPIPHSSSSSVPNIDHHTLFAPPPLPPPPDSLLYSTLPIFRSPARTTATAGGGSDLLMMPPKFSFPFSSYLANGSSLTDLIPQAPVFQRKMVSAKRPFLTCNLPKASVGSTKTIPRETKPNRSIDMRLISPVQDSGTTICNPIAIDSPASIPRHYPMFIPLSLQYEQQQQQQQQQDFDESMQRRSKKPFYSFIPSDDRCSGVQEQRACERYGSAADHGIDLSLKL
ncbi:unnamed protein product [Microthlaspi erraticum]|uniref:Uncharacterized protein n=1 Tax=Microthlaspi erraticum TaxID=1685480 RepID=A0A6D2HYM3_9BRAS|nr:unnamed protein product [Microthlaspi erraticum]